MYKFLEQKLVVLLIRVNYQRLLYPFIWLAHHVIWKSFVNYLELWLYIIEDASHAIGGKYKDKPVGSCQYSDLCVFSFHPVKIITTAEGGCVTTNNPSWDQKIRSTVMGFLRILLHLFHLLILGITNNSH